MDADWLKRVGSRRGVWVADTCRLFMDYTVVVQVCNFLWGISLGESWHVHTHAYLPSRARA
jgi:hypothetical protein